MILFIIICVCILIMLFAMYFEGKSKFLTFEQTAKRIMEGGEKKTMSDKDKRDAQAVGLDLDPKPSGYINPFIKISFEYKGKELTSMPVCLMAHAYLKDYGFDPDSMIDGLKLSLTFAPGSTVKLPFYLKQRVSMSDNFTAEEAKKQGLFINE